MSTSKSEAEAPSTESSTASSGDPQVSFLRRLRTWGKELAIIGVSALVLSLIIKTFFFQSFWIPSRSMESTLDVGDRILVTKWRPGPLPLRHGDIIVFKDPGDWLGNSLEGVPTQRSFFKKALTWVGLLPEDAGEHLVKRVIGLPGDHVKCCNKDGLITVNGFPLHEPYLDDGIAPSMRKFNITVPPNYVWVMGDNRPGSGDSRLHMGDPGGGSVPESLIVGVAFVTVWPFDHWSGHGDPYAGVDIPPPGADAAAGS